MRRNRKYILTGLAVIASAVLLFAITQHPEPEYHGKPVSQWINDLRYPRGQANPETITALHEIGTNAIPYLLELASTKDSALKIGISAVLPQSLFAEYKKPADDHHQLASFGFYTLGPVAKPAIPALINLLENQDQTIRETAAHSLGFIGVDARVAIPNLIKHLKDSDAKVRAASALALGHFKPFRAQIIPTLEESARDDVRRVRNSSFYALDALGARESDKQRIPFIFRRPADSDPKSKPATNGPNPVTVREPAKQK